MRDFDYLEPATIGEALSLLAKYNGKAKVIAGGTDLLVKMKQGKLSPRYVINLKTIPGLDGITYDSKEGLKLGALTPIRSLEKSVEIQRWHPAIFQAASRLGHIAIRNIATLGGNLCNASPSADTASPLLALEASVEISGSDGIRTLELREFFVGPGEAALEDDEIVTEIRVPMLAAGTGTAFLKLTRLAEDLAKVNVAVVLTVQNNVCKEARIALGGVAPTPIRATHAESILKGNQLEDKLIDSAAGSAAEAARPITDVRSTAEYRLEVSKVLVTRALKIAWERAQN